MKSFLPRAVLVSLSLVTAAYAQAPQGDWQGALVLPGGRLQIVVHIQKGADGRYAGSLDSPDQKAKGIPLGTVTANDQDLNFDVPSLRGHYRGTWDGAQNLWKGEWTQVGVLPLNLARIQEVTGIDGDWDGIVDLGATRLRMVFHIRTAQGATMATTDSPDQGAFGMPVSSVTRTGDTVTLEVNQVGATFEARLAAGGQTLSGQMTQRGHVAPFTLTWHAAGSTSLAPRRPQTPMLPYPYREVEVHYPGGAADVRIAGTLTLPEGAGPFPAVVLIQGSGPNDRDESIFGHEIFKVLADHLTRHGIAVLRSDKRGIKASTGDYGAATTVDFAADVTSGIAFLKGRTEIRAGQIGLIGHSEGGVIAPMVARDGSVAFIVLMAGSALPGDQIIESQISFLAHEAGASQDETDKRLELQRKLVAAVSTAPNSTEAIARLREIHGLSGLADLQDDPGAQALSSNWFRFFLTYDPAPALAHVKCPVLAINGSKDFQVAPTENLRAIRAALANNPDVEVRELPGLNHLFQTAKTGSSREYSAIEETIAPSVLELITGWIRKHTSKGAP